MKSITLKVDRDSTGYLVTTYHGQQDARTDWPIQQADQYVPDGPYRVRYTLDPKGDLRIRERAWVENPLTKRGYVVCFIRNLPGWYRGRRVRREVV